MDTPPAGAQLACFTSTKVQILTQKLETPAASGGGVTWDLLRKMLEKRTASRASPAEALQSLVGSHFTCFTSTKVPILAHRL